MPFVPVIRFWETRESISSADLKQALRGNSSDWPRVLISRGDRAALEAALGITIDDSVREASPAAIIAAVKKGKALGILRATDVQPSVRALGIDGHDLFGNDRVRRSASGRSLPRSRRPRRTRGTRVTPGPWSPAVTRSPIVACTNES